MSRNWGDAYDTGDHIRVCIYGLRSKMYLLGPHLEVRSGYWVLCREMSYFGIVEKYI